MYPYIEKEVYCEELAHVTMGAVRTGGLGGLSASWERQLMGKLTSEGRQAQDRGKADVSVQVLR